MRREDRWNPGTTTQYFHPGYQRPNDVPTVAPMVPGTEVDHMSEQEVYISIKMLSSFMNRNGITAQTIGDLSRRLLNEIRRQNYRLASRTLPTLLSLSGLTTPSVGHRIFGNLYQYLYQFFNICLHDLETRNPRHNCAKTECERYCILPLYASRLMPDRKIHALFHGIKGVLSRKPSLICRTQEINEAETALNLLKYLISRGRHGLEDSYDV